MHARYGGRRFLAQSGKCLFAVNSLNFAAFDIVIATVEHCVHAR